MNQPYNFEAPTQPYEELAITPIRTDARFVSLPSSAIPPNAFASRRITSWSDLTKEMRDAIASTLGSHWHKVCVIIGHPRVLPQHIDSNLHPMAPARDKALKFMEMLDENGYLFSEFAKCVCQDYRAFPSAIERYMGTPYGAALKEAFEA